MKLKTRKGFTMVELMIVVIIIGILTTIAVPAYFNSVERAKCSQGMHILKNMRNAALEWYRQNETFSGMSIMDMETAVSADFDSTDENDDWDFSVQSTGASTFTLRATRENRGPHPNMYIEINETGLLNPGGEDYPISNYFN